MPYLSFPTPLGALTLTEDEGVLISLDWGNVEGGNPTPSLVEAKRQIEEYFDGKRRDFQLHLAPLGSTFDTRVWDALSRIPYGEVRAYAALAEKIGTSPRAIGGACGRNPLPILIPCHRVVAKNGSLGGYSGPYGIETKRRLLDLELGGPYQGPL